MIVLHRRNAASLLLHCTSTLFEEMLEDRLRRHVLHRAARVYTCRVAQACLQRNIIKQTPTLVDFCNLHAISLDDDESTRCVLV